ncbi:MAG TPA: YpdA family putative bacillithiol disulfide reductase [Acidobacteriota bacterium]|nr:YpdA family putative bacillithiol disulfide reductase [Acidobacteriota bacterium]
MIEAKVDVAIVGAGPAGLACGIEAKRLGYDYLILEKGCVVNSIYRYPRDMTFFTTADLLEIGDIPMISPFEKPKRIDGLNYYRKVVEIYDLPIRDYTRLVHIEGAKDDFRLLTRTEREAGPHIEETILARRVILALGYYDNPTYLGIPGEDLPNVSHYFTEVHPYFRKKVAVIGGRNSAAEAALLLFRGGADVTLIHRRDALGKEIKYWVLPDIENRIKKKEVRALFNTIVTRIEPARIWLKNGQEEQPLENDFVFALTGYHPDADFLKRIGIQVDPVTYRPQHDPETLESNMPGIYLAGGMVSGKETNKVFIETGRFHGVQIFNSPGFLG